MKCPFCGNEETQVKDSRSAQDGMATRRRRECSACGERFTTFERIQMRELTVMKNGNRKQPFDRDKIIKSMQIALRKRPFDLEEIEDAADRIVKQLETQGDAEIPSKTIGKLVMQTLADMDTIGYIRYASVYKDFRDPEDFNDFLTKAQKLQKAS